MKHLLTFFLVGMIGIMSVNMSYSQAVDDRAVVPVSVTLNSILRLNVESGGNIEFNFNTLSQYENGIANSTEYDTKITIASSVNWDLRMGAEDPYLVASGQSDTAGTNMPLDHVGYQIEHTGTVGLDYTINSDGNTTSLQELSSIADGSEQIQNAGTNAGGGDYNEFTVHWECGTTDTDGGLLLGSPLTGGRYSSNVFFVLQPD